MPLPNFIKNIFSGGASEIINAADSLIDNLTLSKEEKEKFKAEFAKNATDHIEKMAGLTQQETDSYLKDIADARVSNVRIQESQGASWLSKNIAYFLDALISVSFVVMLIMVFFKKVPAENKEIFYTAFGLLGGYVSTVINFHRGTSSGSKASGDTLRKLAEK